MILTQKNLQLEGHYASKQIIRCSPRCAAASRSRPALRSGRRLSWAGGAGDGRAADLTVLFGTHVAGPGKGFSVSSFDAKTGALGKPEFVIEAEAPAYFILADGDKRLYTCNSTGFVSAYAVAEAAAA